MGRSRHPKYDLSVFYGQCALGNDSDRNFALRASVRSDDGDDSRGKPGNDHNGQSLGRLISAHDHEIVGLTLLRSCQECGCNLRCEVRCDESGDDDSL